MRSEPQLSSRPSVSGSLDAPASRFEFSKLVSMAAATALLGTMAGCHPERPNAPADMTHAQALIARSSLDGSGENKTVVHTSSGIAEFTPATIPVLAGDDVWCTTFLGRTPAARVDTPTGGDTILCDFPEGGTGKITYTHHTPVPATQWVAKLSPLDALRAQQAAAAIHGNVGMGLNFSPELTLGELRVRQDQLLQKRRIVGLNQHEQAELGSVTARIIELEEAE